MRKKISISVAVAITLIAMTVTFSITMIVSMNVFDNTVADVLEKQSLYNKLSELDTYVRTNFYDDIDDETLSDRIAQGFIDGLNDDQSVYYTAEQYALLQDIESGRLVGVGLVGMKDTATGYFRIIKVYNGSPAAGTALEAGMLVTAIETGGETYNTKDFSSQTRFNALLRGAQGTNVVLSYETGTGDTGTADIQRVNYQNPTVEYTLDSDNVAYVRIYSFGPDTAADFDYIVREAQGRGAIGFVFDLRGTTGTNVDNAYDMIDLLCPLGTIARAELKSGNIRSLRTSGEEHIDLPAVCIVNAGTSGAAELFAACLRELAGAQLVGERTAGLGLLLRSPQQLLDGSAVVIPYAKLLYGEDKSFDTVGLAPDLETVSTLEDDRTLYNNPDYNMDAQLRRSLELVRSLARAQGLLVDGGEETPAGTGSSGSSTSLPEDSGAQAASESTDNNEGTESTDESDPSGAGDTSLTSSDGRE